MTASQTKAGVYGAPPAELAEVGAEAIQFSPLVPGAEALERLPEGSLDEITMLAPPGTAERRYALALGLRALAPGGRFTVLAPRDKGGTRIAGELAAFGCAIGETSKRHHRICEGDRPETLAGLETAIDGGRPRLVETLGLWSQPGVFSWDRADPGSALLLEHLPPLSGRGADLGCGVGLLSAAVLASPKVESLAMIDVDRRAVEAARRNVGDPRAAIAWADARDAAAVPAGLDFVVMNPPFHDGGDEDRSLGQSFIRRAAAVLRKGGTLWLTANRHLPYEAVLGSLFRRVAPLAQSGGYKVFEAQR